MAEKPFETAHVLELDAIAGPGSLVWRPIRRRFGIEAFGMNAYTADAGNDVVEDHTEESYRHQEVYFVASGRATFTVAGERIDAPAGTFVFIRDFTVRRQAVADEDGTIVVAVGAAPASRFASRGGSTRSQPSRTSTPATTTARSRSLPRDRASSRRRRPPLQRGLF
jgi:quercetin dioxygenase-like cupin family protein